MRVYFATPDGQVIHYIQGYWTADHLREEIQFAQEQYDRIRRTPDSDTKKLVSSTLNDRINNLLTQQSNLLKTFPTEFAKPVRSSKVRQKHAAMGLKVASFQIAKNVAGQEIQGILTMLLHQNLRMGIIK